MVIGPYIFVVVLFFPELFNLLVQWALDAAYHLYTGS